MMLNCRMVSLGKEIMNLHSFKLDSFQDVKNHKYMNRKKMLFKPVNNFEKFLANNNNNKLLRFPSSPFF